MTSKVKLKDQVREVTDQEDDALNGFAADCPLTAGCGGEFPVDPKDPDGPREHRSWSSVGHPTRELALARLEEHIHEHRTGEPMSDLDTFRAKHGVGVQDGKAVVTLEDLA